MSDIVVVVDWEPVSDKSFALVQCVKKFDASNVPDDFDSNIGCTFYKKDSLRITLKSLAYECEINED